MDEQKNGLGVWVIQIWLTNKRGKTVEISAIKQQHSYRAPEVETDNFADLLYWALKRKVNIFDTTFEVRRTHNLVLLKDVNFYTLQEPVSGSMFYDLLKQEAENQGIFLSDVIKVSAHFYLLKGKELYNE